MARKSPNKCSSPIITILQALFLRKRKGLFQKRKGQDKDMSTYCSYERHHEDWVCDLPGLTWKLYIQERHTQRHQGFNPHFCFNNDYSHTVKDSCYVHPVYVCVHARVYTPTFTFPNPLLSLIYTVICLASQSSTKEVKREQEFTSPWCKQTFL